MELCNFQGKIISRRRSTTLNIESKTIRKCVANAAEVTEDAKQFKLGHCVSADLDKKKYGIARARTNEMHGA